ncbi:unnamed protein product [Echinostoma caproni]|uniref:Methylcytosine dioxygenase TET n=1 Tax=Echinostoma caproni TaxID=27848 RepID=A0A183AF89_9TREM|nr:unnamed protein product [Echinostoma caproni]
MCKNWPPDNNDRESPSEDNGDHTDVEDVQVKAILCRAMSATESQCHALNEVESKTGQDVVKIIAQPGSTKAPTEISCGQNIKHKKMEPKLTFQERPNMCASNEVTFTNEKTIDEKNNPRESTRELKRSVGQIGPVPSLVEPKRPFTSQVNTREEMKNTTESLLGIYSTQMAAHVNISPGTVSVSSLLGPGLQVSNSETQASPSVLKKTAEWPNGSTRTADFNKFMRETALNNIQSVLNETNQGACFDDSSVTSACTMMRSSIAEEPSAHTIVEGVSTATVVCPAVGKTSRGTQSEQLEQVKVVRDMQIQTGFVEIPEGIPLRFISAYEEEQLKHLNSCRTSPVTPTNRGNQNLSRLPIPTANLVRVDWAPEAKRPPNDSTKCLPRTVPQNMNDIESEPFVSPSPTSYIILPQIQSFKRNSNPSGPAKSICNPKGIVNGASALQHHVPVSQIPVPEQSTVPRRSLYQLVRDNAPSVSNSMDLIVKTNKVSTTQAPKSPQTFTAIPVADGRTAACMFHSSGRSNTVEDDCQGDTGDKERQATLHRGEVLKCPNKPLNTAESKDSHNLISGAHASVKGSTSPVAVGNEDVVFVEGSSSQNSSQGSTVQRSNQTPLFRVYGNPSAERYCNRMTVNNSEKAFNISGDHTTETCGCCRDGTCDCPTSSTITGSHPCTCEFCHGSGTGQSERLNKVPQAGNSLTIRRTAGDEGSFRIISNHGVKLGQRAFALVPRVKKKQTLAVLQEIARVQKKVQPSTHLTTLRDLPLVKNPIEILYLKLEVDPKGHQNQIKQNMITVVLHLKVIAAELGSKRAIRSNSEGSLEYVEGRCGLMEEYPGPRRRLSRSTGWRATRTHVPPLSVQPGPPTAPSSLATTLARVAQDINSDRNAWIANQHGRFFSPARTDTREMPLHTRETPTGFPPESNFLQNTGQSRNNKLTPSGKNYPVLRDGKRPTNRFAPNIPKPPGLQQNYRTDVRNPKIKQAIGQLGCPGTQMKVVEGIGFQNRSGSFSMPRPGNVVDRNEFEVERIFELSQYDDLVKSYLNVADRRIKAVALKNGCDIRIVGPITKPDPSAIGISGRSRITFNCHIAGPSEDRIGKCVNFLKETFPNSFLRTNWRA